MRHLNLHRLVFCFSPFLYKVLMNQQQALYNIKIVKYTFKKNKLPRLLIQMPSESTIN